MKPSLDRERNEREQHRSEVARRAITLAARMVADGAAVARALSLRNRGLTNAGMEEVGEALLEALTTTGPGSGGQSRSPINTLVYVAQDVLGLLDCALESPDEADRIEVLEAGKQLLPFCAAHFRDALRLAYDDPSPAVKASAEELREVLAESILGRGLIA